VCSDGQSLFDVEWQENSGSIAMRAANGSYVYNKPTGSLTAGSESVTEKVPTSRSPTSSTILLTFSVLMMFYHLGTFASNGELNSDEWNTSVTMFGCYRPFFLMIYAARISVYDMVSPECSKQS
jgi:hypothetical protein